MTVAILLMRPAPLSHSSLPALVTILIFLGFIGLVALLRRKRLVGVLTLITLLQVPVLYAAKNDPPQPQVPILDPCDNPTIQALPWYERWLLGCP